ncbi:Short-chain dehydrogenase/reductase SDR [Penicillium cf. griseofulvum]|uniref:Short-chain dehydrogenase/reductase SDR n=1 Tax=Penicillium cf. griseofulvum TaxID=2972120 RepID=A0A9W9N0C6_9EURO|nr:Short-chain dehydrogenase/reductase SDR [Penicillium cf. griseofulvum]KAJ5422284.1 Short-chain dehydrogenase/reductase SDR [Penicillium cf. griseofulvum]
MAAEQISDDILGGIKGQVVLITGGSSGIGKATAQLCLKHGANVIIADINSLPSDLETSEKLRFIKTDVCSWESQRDAFIQIEEWFGRIDHVFANAGLGPTINFLDESLDENGQLTPPNLQTINVNLLGVISTVRLATYYIQKHSVHRASGELGSIVVAASAASFQNFSAGDYTIAKHGVLGLIRGIGYQLEGKVRLNSVAPSWTATSMIDAAFIERLGVGVQGPEAVARIVCLLFNDQQRHGDVIYSWDGKYQEVNKAEGGMLAAADGILVYSANEESVVRKLREEKMIP